MEEEKKDKEQKAKKKDELEIKKDQMLMVNKLKDQIKQRLVKKNAQSKDAIPITEEEKNETVNKFAEIFDIRTNPTAHKTLSQICEEKELKTNAQSKDENVVYLSDSQEEEELFKRAEDFKQKKEFEWVQLTNSLLKTIWI